MRDSYDIVVIGAGPVGSTAAALFAERGRQVLLLEANPKAARRFAGEWMHPPGVKVLEQLGIDPFDAIESASPSVGFVVFPDDGSEPIELLYPKASVGFTCEHHALVDTLRRRARDCASVTYRPYARVTEVGGGWVRFDDAHSGRERRADAELIVGADGRGSITCEARSEHVGRTAVSYMGALTLEDGELPVERFGHVVLGGPGPVLAYRLGPRRVRVSFDVPAHASAVRRDQRALLEVFGPLLPAGLAGPVEHALEHQRVRWAATHFRPRTNYGFDRVVAVGDAVGSFHPMTAAGMTLGLQDVAKLADAESLQDYQARRAAESYVPELLSSALYDSFAGQDDSARVVRQAIYQVWRDHPDERERTMRLLSGDDIAGATFALSFLRVGLRAVGMSSRAVLRDRRLPRLREAVPAMVPWSHWPLAGLMPAPVRNALRETSTIATPFAPPGALFDRLKRVALDGSAGGKTARRSGFAPRGDRPSAKPQPLQVDRAIDRALARLEDSQDASGCWEGAYGGPLFLLPLYVAVLYTIGQTRALPAELRLDGAPGEQMRRYIRGQQNVDGGWGLHVEGDSEVYPTVLNYVALRLLGEAGDDAALAQARRWIEAHGGPTKAAPWGKFVLALLGLLPHAATLPVQPELWLLPRALPVHPGRMWCHARMVYLPMSFLYATRSTARRDATLDEIRAELFRNEEDIDWAASMTNVAPTDEYTPLHPVFRAVNRLQCLYERHAPKALRERALEFVLDQIDREDQNTNYICIGPINKLLNTLCWYFARPDGRQLERHLARLPEYLWRGDDGLEMQGYNSSRLWDTTFAVQATFETGRAGEHRNMLEGAHRYIEANQVLEDVPEREHAFRARSRGGWPFSDRDHGWPITDCTAEGLKASLKLAGVVDEPIRSERLGQAVEQILALQNDDGGWATYEKRRAPEWLEVLNPSMCFGKIMVDYSYVECTSACVQALAAFRKHRHVAGGRLERTIAEAIERGARFLLDAQRDDGSWYGSWGICFTYGTWFGVEGLRAAGFEAHSRPIRAACKFLKAHQLADGGWGETIESCRDEVYRSTDSGQAVMTSWALLALEAAGRLRDPAVARGVRFLLERQRPDGTWPDEHIAGVFNRTCAIHYDNYLKVFPLWALARFNRSVSAGNEQN